MATVLVKSDADQSILMTEFVLPIHLDNEFSALQFLERLYGAVEDAEAPQRAKRREARHRAGARRQACARR